MGVNSIMNDAGRIGFVIKGDYDSTTTYDFLDIAYFNGATYVAKKLTVGNTPDNTEFWHILVDGNIDVNDIAPTFLQAETRENINSGEKLPVIFGKIKKFFADLKTVAFTGSYNDLSNKPSASDIGAVATSKVLDTAELISANTASGNVAGALAVKTIQANLNNKVPLAYGDIGNADDAPEGWCSLASGDGKNNPTTFWVSLHTHYINSAKTYGTQEAYPWGKQENGDFWIRNKDNGIWSEWVYVGNGKSKYVKLWSGNAGSNETVTFTTDISKLNWRKLLISFYYSTNNNTVYCEIPIVYTSIQRNIFINTYIGTVYTIPGDVLNGSITFDWSDSNYRLAEIYAELN